jgi:hypothetical protein
LVVGVHDQKNGQAVRGAHVPHFGGFAARFEKNAWVGQ